MINPLLIQEVFDQPWCINNQYLHGLAMMAYSMLSAENKMLPALPNGSTDQQAAFSYLPVHAYTPGSRTKQSGDSYAPGSVGVVVIDGPIVQNSDLRFGIKGTMEAAQEFQRLEADPNIIGTVFYNNSGGGAVYAIKPLDDVLASLKKPVVDYSKQMVASAAYRLAARTQHIMMYHPHGIAGSLGTMSSFSDMMPMFEKWGMKFFEYYATESVLKNSTYNKARQGDGKALIENVLDPMNKEFIAAIRQLRGDKISEKDKSIYQGETFLATDAIKLGLIDSLGELSDAINMVATLDKGAPPKPNASLPAHTTPNNNLNMKFPKLLALAGKETFTQEELDEVNAELADANISGVGIYPESIVSDAAAVTQKRDELQTQLTEANNQVNTLNGTVAILTGENKELKEKVSKGPAAAAPAAAKEDVATEPTAAEAAAKKISSLPHYSGVLDNPLFAKQ